MWGRILRLRGIKVQVTEVRHLAILSLAIPHKNQELETRERSHLNSFHYWQKADWTTMRPPQVVEARESKTSTYCRGLETGESDKWDKSRLRFTQEQTAQR